ncbi:hypothetical protein J437_LFUL008367 [Ladona fulva]|uniref:Peptidase S1 domain-containing protein n=1 Tax=Ladona fulva TaxID=123851 RepID=A0A8K0K8N7_LADFU|nr:hypothetical protein J437_LFUL008367 [Ladona fulva]
MMQKQGFTFEAENLQRPVVGCNYYKTACSSRTKYAEPRNEGVNELALENEFPHMAAIGYGKKEEIIWGCGGSLISENFVLTAAHCLQYGSFPAAWVRLGAVKIRNYLRDGGSEAQTYPIISRIPHPEFKASSKYYDIALLKIGSPLGTDELPLISKNIHPACLQVDEEEISAAIVTGWGSIGYGKSSSGFDTSIKGEICSLSDGQYGECKLTKDCNHAILLIAEGKKPVNCGFDMREPIVCCPFVLEEDRTPLTVPRIGSVTQQAVESNLPGGKARKEFPDGDSGGSLQIVKDKGSCQHQIMGVTSFAKSCMLQQSTAVYSRVPFYLKWIEDQVWKDREICSLSDGQYGECKLTKDCNHAILLIAEGKKPVNCGFDMREPIVCCPFALEEDRTPLTVPRIGSVTQQAVESNLPGGKARKACNKYKSVCKSNSDDSELYPHLAFIGYGEMNDIQWACAGSLISENFVLMAAHCITDLEQKTARWVRLGSHLSESSSRRSSNGSVIGQIHPILNIIQYPGYDIGTQLNDLALLKIGVAVEPDSFSTLSSSIHPACLQTSTQPITEAVGLGVSEIGTWDHIPLKIQRANLDVIRDSVCDAIRISNKHNEEDKPFLCTQVTSKGKFLCSFNSEGPMLVKNQIDGSCPHKVAGILMKGQLCGYNNATIIYTQICPYLKWIEDNVWP